MGSQGPPSSSVATARPPIMARPRVAPLPVVTTAPAEQSVRTAANASPTIADLLVRPGDNKLQHTSSHLRLQLQWSSAYKMQLLVMRNAVLCCVCAVMANGAFYIGNPFAFKSSVDQSLPEFTMAMLVWMAISYAVIMVVAHVPSLTTQRFLECPEVKPSHWFCAKKLMKRSRLAFTATLVGMVAVGLLVQHTSLMVEHFRYRMHFYLAIVNNLTFTAGLTLAVRRTYYEETYQGRDRRCAVSNLSEPRANSPRVQRPHPPPKHRSPSFWREYVNQLPNALIIALAGAYVHAVLTSWQRIMGQASVMLFTAFGVILKLTLQEVARWYVLKKKIRSVRTMCMLVCVPTVLIDTQSRIVLLGTQANSFLVVGTFGMAVAELCLRATKAAFVVWTTRRRARALEDKLQQISNATRLPEGSTRPLLPSAASVKLEFELWKRQTISYHTAELTADMYAEYIAMGCSQSIVFWWVGHPLYPVLQLQGGSLMAEIDVARWRFYQVAMLGFQFVVEVFVAGQPRMQYLD
jgi:hypothetical protein